ncbi:MAG: hypothetical protein ACRDKU_03415 [Gaiellaceae bacterium]
MKIKTSRRLVKRLGLALAVAAAFAPNAQAMPMDVKSGGSDSVQSRQYADDLRAESPVRHYADDRVASVVGEHQGYAPINEQAQSVVSSPEATSSSIDWSGTTIGAGALFLVLGFGGILIAVRHSRRGRLAAV